MKLDTASSSFLGEVTWEPVACSQWCSMSGMCPTSGSAQDGSCLARPTDAVGEVTDSRCVRWCDSNTKLTVTVTKNLPCNTTVGISFTMLNPTFGQTASPLIISSSGSCFYMRRTKSNPFQAPQESFLRGQRRHSPSSLSLKISATANLTPVQASGEGAVQE